MADLIAKGLSDTAMIKLRKRKELDGFAEKDWASWLTFLARDQRIEETFREQIHRQTSKFLLSVWMENFSENLPEIRGPGSKTIADLVPNRQNLDEPEGSAIVIGRGPSVFKKGHLKMLAESDFRGTIICSDGILIDALKAGVTPDKYRDFFVVTVDGNRERIVKWYDDPLVDKFGSKIKACLSTTVAHNVYERCRRAGIEVYWFHPLFDDYRSNESFSKLMSLMTTTEEHRHGIAKVSCGGNTGSTSWVLAHALLRHSPTCLIGLDLGYPEGTPLEQTHYFCYSDDTRVLTEGGFKHFFELSPEDRVATLNRITDKLEYQRPIQIFRYPYQGKLLRFWGRFYDLMVTPNHRLYCRRETDPRRDKIPPYRFVEASNLASKKHPECFIQMRHVSWEGVEREKIEIPTVPQRFSELVSKRESVLKLRQEKGWGCIRLGKAVGVDPTTVYGWIYRGYNPNRCGGNPRNIEAFPTDLWMKFMGWYISEGSIVPKGPHRIEIPQGNPKYLEDIAQIVESLGFRTCKAEYTNVPAIEFYSKQICEYLKPLGKARQKYIPPELKTLPPKYLKTLLITLCKGDGSIRGGEPRHYYTSSKRLADDVMEIALKCGYTAATHYQKNGIYLVKILRNHPETHVSGKIEQVGYDGFVYSVSVPNEIILVERNGKPAWSGNSSLMEATRGDMRSVQSAYREVVNPNGERAISDLVFWHYREAFLEMARDVNPKFKTINATGSGTLFGEGITWMKFEDFLRRYKD